MNKFVITYLSHRGMGGYENVYPETYLIESLASHPQDVYLYYQRAGGFNVNGLLCRRWVPVSAIISVDTEHDK